MSELTKCFVVVIAGRCAEAGVGPGTVVEEEKLFWGKGEEKKKKPIEKEKESLKYERRKI